MKGLALGGFMGVGKTTIAKLTSEKLNLSSIDLDYFIMSKTGESISNIFKLYGESGFRDLEKKYLNEILMDPPEVLSLGGGTLHQSGVVELIRHQYLIVILHAELKTILNRIGGTDRPLQENATQLFRDRVKQYQKLGIVIHTEGMKPDEICEKVISVWRSAA